MTGLNWTGNKWTYWSQWCPALVTQFKLVTRSKCKGNSTNQPTTQWHNKVSVELAEEIQSLLVVNYTQYKGTPGILMLLSASWNALLIVWVFSHKVCRYKKNSLTIYINAQVAIICHWIHIHPFKDAVRAICLSPWELLLGDWSRAGRKILSILQGEPRSTNLAGKSLENTLRIPVPGGYLNTILVRATCLSLWELLLRDQSRAGREILSILQDRQRSTNLAGKFSENTLRISVQGAI